jgi:hypothetical protein
MGYLIGAVLSVAVAALAAVVGFDRERTFYATVLIVVASYYVLFAVMGASPRIQITEIAIATGFLALAVVGFRRNYWLVAAALVGHGVFDFVHGRLIDNPGVPRWWPGFCLAFDAVFGVLLAMQLIKHPERVRKDTRT